MNKLKILGIGMTFVLLVSLIGFAGIATAAGPGEQNWDYILNPSDSTYKIALGSLPIDFVFSGAQGYLIEHGYGSSSTRGRVFSSNNSGQYWSNKSTFQSISGWSTSVPPVAVAVAPDDKLSIAVTDGINVWISNDGGTTWSALPAIGVAGTVKITDVAIGPAISGGLFPRHYAVTIANTAAGSVASGDVLVLGANTAWASAANGITGIRDYLTVEFSPSYVGDRTLVALGASLTTLDLQLLRVATTAVAPLDTQAVIPAASALVPERGGANAALAADIALPSDFDPSATGTDKVFVGLALTAATGGVFRVIPSDDTNTNLLATNVKSVAYSGTITAGTLFTGFNLTNDVRRTEDPFASSPTWTSASKKPTGIGVIVRLDSSYASNQTIFAVTTTDAFTTTGGSSFNVSSDNGVSFDQWSMIDYTGTYTASASNLGSILEFELTSDELAHFYLTNDKGIATSGVATPPTSITGSLHLWKAPSPLTSTTFSQMLTIPKASTTNNTGLLALNPAWATTPAIYVVDNTALGASTFYVSQNGGATWQTRSGPPIAADARIESIAVTDANTVFAIGGGKAYKSTNAGFIWADGVTAGSGSMNIWQAPTGELIQGRAGSIYTTTNQGTTNWSVNSLGLTSGIPYYAAVDQNYATNKVYFVAGNDGSVWRRGSADSSWVNISPGTLVAQARPVIRFGDGVMYVLTTDGVLRNLEYLNVNPATASGAWEKMDALGVSFFYPAAIPAAPNNTMAFQGPLNCMLIYGGNNIVVANKVYRNFSYRDLLANTAPSVTAPADNLELTVDPNTGFGQPVTFAWETLGTGAGVPNSFEIDLKQVGGTSQTSGTFDVNDIGAPSISSSTLFGNQVFRANSEYTWRLRVRDTLSGDAVRSVWSAPRTIKVLAGSQVVPTQAGPVLLGPQGGASTNLRPGFSWAPVAGATEYEFVLATNAGLTNPVAGTPVKVTVPAFQPAADLTANTTYFWGVKVTAPAGGIQSIGTFTAAAPVATTPATTAPATQPTITVSIPPQPTATVTVTPPAQAISPALVWVVIIIGAILIIAVLVLIVRTRRPV